MSVSKRGNVWWYKFHFNGQRIRESAKTSKKSIAIEAEKDHRRRLERANVGLPSEEPEQRTRTVDAVLKAYERAYPANHRDGSVVIVRNRSKHVAKAFGRMLLPDLTQDRILEYMQKRKVESASNRTINLELIVLSRAMGSTWKVLWPKVKKLEENTDVGRALEVDEEARLLSAAAGNQSKLIHPYLMTLTWTGMRSDEARMLRWSQVDFDAPQVMVGKAKTKAGRGRVIPMSAALKMALEKQAAFCAREFGPLQPEWFVFPRSNRIRLIDPTKPVTSLKTAWNTVRDDANVSCRLHDLRHSFCTKLAEAGVPESTMLDMMGHVSPSMLRRYSHIRAQARRDAIAALEGLGAFGVATKMATIAVLEEKEKTTTLLPS